MTLWLRVEQPFARRLHRPGNKAHNVPTSSDQTNIRRPATIHRKTFPLSFYCGRTIAKHYAQK